MAHVDQDGSIETTIAEDFQTFILWQRNTLAKFYGSDVYKGTMDEMIKKYCPKMKQDGIEFIQDVDTLIYTFYKDGEEVDSFKMPLK